MTLSQIHCIRITTLFLSFREGQNVSVEVNKLNLVYSNRYWQAGIVGDLDSAYYPIRQI